MANPESGVHRYNQEFKHTFPDGTIFKADKTGCELRDSKGVLEDFENEWPWSTEEGSPVDLAAKEAGLIPISSR